MFTRGNIFQTGARACLKKAFCKMCVTICGRFCPDEGAVAGYGNWIRAKYTAKWGVQIVGMIFQTHSRIVHRISQKRVTYPWHVNPDLMGSSGFQLKLNKSHIAETFYVLIIRNCIPASWQQSIWRNCHFHGIFRIRGKWYSNFFPEYRIICFW